VTDPKKAVVALKWTVREMEDRYRRMSKLGVRNVASYNERAREAQEKGEHFERTVQTGFDEQGRPVYESEKIRPEPMPYLVVVMDEMADLMLVAGKDVEGAVQRLAQMARAAGIHLIMATQRPSVDVITGTIKANFPTRISFQVTSKIDSRTILGEQGGEQQDPPHAGRTEPAIGQRRQPPEQPHARRQQAGCKRRHPSLSRIDQKGLGHPPAADEEIGEARQPADPETALHPA